MIVPWAHTQIYSVHRFIHGALMANTPQAAIPAWSVSKETSAQNLQHRIDPNEFHKGDSKYTGKKGNAINTSSNTYLLHEMQFDTGI